jgi:hypothetical protein
MRAIGDIATLSMGNDIIRSAAEPSFLTKCGTVEKTLRQYLDTTKRDSLTLKSATDNGVVTGHLEKVCYVTRVFATAALVQMQTTIPSYESNTQIIHELIEDNLAAIKSIQNSQDIRNLVWSICISGSMAPPRPASRSFTKVHSSWP